jgi:Myb/SANT-like DNA-binding domain
MEDSAKRKTALFVQADVDLLMSEVQSHKSVLNNKKTSGVTPAMKREVSIHLIL